MKNLKRVQSALFSLDSSCSREEWVRIGMAAKSAGLSFDDFHRWSNNGANYKDAKDCKQTWNSLDESGDITAGTLFYMAKKSGWNDSTSNYHRVQNNYSAKQNHKKNYAAKNQSAFDIWEKCLSAPTSHGYITQKQGFSDGVRVYPNNAPDLIILDTNVKDYLIVPCLSENKIQTLQFIPPISGKKLNLPGASFNNGYFTVGSGNDYIYICENIGVAWSVHRAINACAVVCFGAGRIKPISDILRKQHPYAQLIIVPDRGKEKEAFQIAISIGGKLIELPNNKPTNYDANDYAKEHGHNALASLLSSPITPEMRYKLLSGSDLCNVSPMRWIVNGILPSEGLAALYGASGSGKSFLVLDMAFAIASGYEYWFGHRVTQVPVTYVALEGESGLSKRIKAWNYYYQKMPPDNLRFIIQPVNLLSGDVEELANAIRVTGHTKGLIILDTLNRAAPGADENSSVDMGKIITAAKNLQYLIGGTVLLIHHTGKDSTKGLRGHSSLYAALDAAVEVIKTDTRREWTVSKSKDDATGNTNPFKLEIIPVGNDEFGDEITSCVAVFDNSKNILQKKQISLGCNQKIALGEIDKMLSTSPYIGKDGSPPEARCVDYGEAITNVAQLIPADAKHKKSRAATAIAGLIGKYLLGMKGSWMWRI